MFFTSYAIFIMMNVQNLRPTEVRIITTPVNHLLLFVITLNWIELINKHFFLHPTFF